MQEAVKKAGVLLEALPYIREFRGKTVVIKYGGNAMIDEALKQSFARCVVLLRYIGVNPVIVHGGGPQIGRMLKALGIASHFREGLRVTDEATMDVVEMVLAGKVNKQIVNLLNQAGGKAVGLSGKDGGTIRCRRLKLSVSREDAPPELIDIGNVGEVTAIDPTLLSALEGKGFIPVVAPVGVNDAGETFNINADTVAGALASAMKAKRLILLTDVAGVLDAEGKLVSSMTLTQAEAAIGDGTARGGMIPKVRCCLKALEGGVEKAHIIDGRVENSLLLELFTTGGIGTQIMTDKEPLRGSIASS